MFTIVVGSRTCTHLAVTDVTALVMTTVEAASFEVTPLEWWDANQEFHQRVWTADVGGPVSRTVEHDPRNRDGGLNYTSLLVDAFKVPIPPP